MDLGALHQQFTDFINSDAVQLFFRAILIYIVLLWLATAFWAYRDMQQRTTNPIAPYLAATLIIVFTPIAFVFAYFMYKIVRPKETVSEANERALAEEAMLVEIESQPHCANCSRPVHEEWIICPTCRNRLRRVCPNCSRLVELDWSLCAYCGKDFERPGATGLLRGVAWFTHDDPTDRPPELFACTNTLHTGERYQSYLLLPMLPVR